MRRSVGLWMSCLLVAAAAWAWGPVRAAGDSAKADPWKPYSAPCVEREAVFAFTEKPAVKVVGQDKYEITFAVKGNCDVTVGLIDEKGTVVRHLGSGVLGANPPAPFQKNSLKQTIYWNGKDDLDLYPKEPEKFKVRVSLGLKPEFEKRFGGTSPHNLPGKVWGLVASPDGVYVASIGHYGRFYLRVFDHDGKYLRSLQPPPADLPEAKLEGMGYVEYEPGKKTLHARSVYNTVADAGDYLSLRNAPASDCQPVLVGDRIFFCDSGVAGPPGDAWLYSIHTDGSTDERGLAGRLFTWATILDYPRLTASPDGQWIYLAMGAATRTAVPAVLRARIDGKDKAEPFLGKVSKNAGGGYDVFPGSDNTSFQQAVGIDCDAQGRIYVADQDNNRIQVFSGEGQYLKTIAADRPYLVQVHRKTGGIYVMHFSMVNGESIPRLTKFQSFDDPREAYHVDKISAVLFAVDSWSAKPRLWTGRARLGGAKATREDVDRNEWTSVQMYEEDGGTCRKILDFDESAKTADGPRYLQRWRGSRYDKVACDVVRNKLYYAFGKHNGAIFVIDLESGNYEGQIMAPPEGWDDIAFDKKGYMHIHFNPGMYMQGVGRLDPGQAADGGNPTATEHSNPRWIRYPEVPYDYGELPEDENLAQSAGKFPGREAVPVSRLRQTWAGILPVKDQGGCKAFQDGIGVNMRGDVAEECNIYYVPRMDDVGKETALGGSFDAPWSSGSFGYGIEGARSEVRGRAVSLMEQMFKERENVYFLPREAGAPLVGGTISTYDSRGEAKAICGVVAGHLINGVEFDEDRNVYFVNSRVRAADEQGTPFLMGKGGIFGGGVPPLHGDVRNPLTGTLLKAQFKDTRVRLSSAPVPLDEKPNRPPDLIEASWAHDGLLKDKNSWAWVEGAQWLYAGASPITFRGCACPTLRIHTDWYKRTFVPEQYRHSIGVLDTNGNLILHIGQYGNLDSGDGPKSKIPVGGDGIAMSLVRFISGTDDRLVFDDHGERLVCLKLNYHAQETVGIGGK